MSTSANNFNPATDKPRERDDEALSQAATEGGNTKELRSLTLKQLEERVDELIGAKLANSGKPFQVKLLNRQISSIMSLLNDPTFESSRL
jgi:hypothetical protein